MVTDKITQGVKERGMAARRRNSPTASVAVIGYNRRAVYADSAVMCGKTNTPNFRAVKD